MKKSNHLEKLIENGVKIKGVLDVAIMSDRLGLYPKEIFEWNTECVVYLKQILNSDILLFQFTKSDQILTGLKGSNGAMISLFETPYSIKKEPADISTLLENKLNFLISIQNKGKEMFEKIDGVEYSFNERDLTGKLIIDSQDPIRFSGQTALILGYFYIKGKSSGNYSTYKDFNVYQERLGFFKKVSSNIFSQTIRSINKTVNKPNNDIKEIICQEKKTTNKNIANAYRWSYKK